MVEQVSLNHRREAIIRLSVYVRLHRLPLAVSSERMIHQTKPR